MEQQEEGQAPPPGVQHPPILQNETPSAISNAFYAAVLFVQSYGWFLLFGVIGLVFLKSRLDPVIQKMKQKREQQREEASYDSDEALKRQEAMEAARMRLQQQHDTQAAKFAEEQKKKEEAKRQEKIQDWERHQRGAGYRSKYRPPEAEASTSSSSGSSSSSSESKPKPKTTYRSNDYSPLTGGGGGACFRPGRRGGSGGGG